MKKKILAAVIALACSLSLSACAPSQGVTLEFSEYYQSADNFEEIEPLLNQYFSMVQAAYDNSDKTNLESFVLDDGYEEVADALEEIRDEIDDISIYDKQILKQHVIQLNLVHPYLLVHAKILERDAIVNAKSLEEQRTGERLQAENPEWFTELNEELSETYTEYVEGAELKDLF